MAIGGDLGGVSRREVLKRGTVTGSVVAVGLLTGYSGTTPTTSPTPSPESGEQSDSGSGFIPTPAAKKKAESWSSFEVVGEFDGTYDEPQDPSRAECPRFLEQAPDCGDDEPVTIYQGYRIKRVGGDLTKRRDIAILFVNPNLTLSTGVALALTDVEHGCRGVLYGGGKGTHEEDTSKVSFASA